MDKRELMSHLRRGGFTVFDITEKRPVEYQEKHGVSFDTFIDDREYLYVTVNGGKFKCARACEENGSILFIYNGEQIRYDPQDIQKVEVTTI